MALRLEDKWLWDFWFTQNGLGTHIFYLQAPRSLGQEELRHWHVSIGHAVSRDLVHWEILPDALEPSEVAQDNAFDSYTTWTGSVIKHQGRWFLFYTGGKRAEEGLIQRIGVATSEDLLHWRKHPRNPLLEADPRWYELLGSNSWHDQAWRDPWVFQHPANGDFHALITARANSGPIDARGVIGHATSKDLLHWQVQPPLTQPGEFGHMEVPQLLRICGRYYLLFSCPHQLYARARRERRGMKLQTGTHYLVADSPLGPFSFVSDDFLVGDERGSLYSGKILRDSAGNWRFLAFRNFGPNEEFLGELSDPYPVSVMPDGRLHVTLPE